METLWSMSTTIREAERIPDFLMTAKEIENEEWNAATQIKFQILLIKNRQYLDSGRTQDFNKLSQVQIDLLKDKSIQLTYGQAESIFNAKNYESPDMRGRQSMSPLVKLGLIDKDSGKIVLTDAGNKLSNDEIKLDEFLFDSFLKLQYPNKIETEHTEWNTKPFINILRLIKKVNELCREKKLKEKGITKIEFGIFALSLKNYNDINNVAYKIIGFRLEYEALKDNKDKDNYVKNYINTYLCEFKNPVKNVKEYSDNIIRYMRITKYIYIRGKYGYACVDIEPRRAVEINSLLEADNGAAKEYTKSEWIDYFGTYGTYKLPYETIEKLTEILINMQNDINKLEMKLGINKTTIVIGTDKETLKETIEGQRAYRLKLQNIEIKFDYNNDFEKIDEAINSLKNIRKLDLKPSIALEKWTNIALNIINDSELIKPNSIMGDDNEPTFTAPAGVADIECYYETFNATCEVTMLKGRDQWYNEGQPVMRHLREFQDKNIDKPAYCLFVAPSLHEDAIETFYTGVRHKYKGKKQKIIPITINQLISMLETVKKMKLKGKKLSHVDVMNLYESCTTFNDNDDDSTVWLRQIETELKQWENVMIA